MTDSKPDVLSAASVELWAAINALPPPGVVCTVARMKGVVRVEKALDAYASEAVKRYREGLTPAAWIRGQATLMPHDLFLAWAKSPYRHREAQKYRPLYRIDGGENDAA